MLRGELSLAFIVAASPHEWEGALSHFGTALAQSIFIAFIFDLHPGDRRELMEIG